MFTIGPIETLLCLIQGNNQIKIIHITYLLKVVINFISILLIIIDQISHFDQLSISMPLHKDNPSFLILIRHPTNNIEDRIYCQILITRRFCRINIRNMENGLLVGIQHLINGTEITPLIEVVPNPQ